MKFSSFTGLLHRPNALIGGTIIIVMLVAALFGVLKTPYDPIIMNFNVRLSPPSLLHLLGTDEWGRDVFSRLLTGASITISISFVVVLITTLCGTVIGAMTGFFGGLLSRCTMALVDGLQAFPGLILALAIIAVFGPSRIDVVVALSLAYLPAVIRVVRSSVLSAREKEYVEASRVMGNSEFYTMFRHALPNSISPIIVLATALFGWTVLAESELSFLGLGVPPPAPSWGGMLAASRIYFSNAPWLAIAPGLCISLTLLGVNLLGDGIRDQFDPRMKNL